MPLIDKLNRPLKDLRISLIDRCNFRCPYCMPEEQFHQKYAFLNKDEWLSFDEIMHVVSLFVKQGVRKIRLTGGEPLLRPEVDVLIARLSKIVQIEDLALTTNGSLLTQWAFKLKKSGLKRITVSLDSLNPQVFKMMSGGRGVLQEVLDGIKAAQDAGFENIKINAVIQRGVNEDSLIDLCEFSRIKGYGVRFIEYMDVGNQNQWQMKQVVPIQEMLKRIQAVFPLIYVGDTSGGETSQRYRFKDGKGEVGFIASVTQAFCSTCERLRLSADGKLYTCLFATHGHDIKELLRLKKSDEEIIRMMSQVWNKREDQYSQKRTHLRQEHPAKSKVEMYHIGG